MRGTLSSAASCLLLACASSAAPDARTPRHSPTPPLAATVPATAQPQLNSPDPRAMAPGASFATLLLRTRSLIEGGQGSDARGCLLESRQGGGALLRADLMPAIKPLPDADPDLAQRLEASVRPVPVLTAWGERSSQRDHDVSVATFTSLTPQAAARPMVIVLLTDTGTHLRYSDQFAEVQDGPLSEAVAASRLSDLLPRGPFTVLVTAAPTVPLDRIVTLLAGVPETCEVALAVALPAGTHLPAPPVSTPGPPSALLCPEGLPAPDADVEDGELPQQAILEALAPLNQAAGECVAQASGRAAAGGTMLLAIRVNPDGRPGPVCLIADEPDDPTLRVCIVEAARALRFTAPVPSGLVDLHLPLKLEPTGVAAQRALCPPP